MRAVFAFLQDALRIRPDEVKRTGLAFLYLFTTIGAFITARIAKSSLFLEIPGYREQLPLTYIGIAFTVSFVMSRYAKVERKLRRDHTNLISLGAIMLVTLGFRWLLTWEPASGLILDNPKHEIYWAFLIWAELLGALLIVQFWSLIPEIFNSRQAKRLFALIGGGGVLANIAFGKGNKLLVDLIGTENLLFVIVACLGMSAIAVWRLSVDARDALVAAKGRAPSKKNVKVKLGADFFEVFRTRHVQLIAAVIVLTYLVSAMVDYQFNVIVGDSITGKDDRSAYFSDFFAYTGIIAAVIQFTLTSRILERFGVLFALLLLPLCMLGGTATIVLGMMLPLAAATFTKGSENVLRYTVNDSTLQLLYLPVPSEIRGRAKAIIDGIFKPLSMGAAGFITALLVGTLDRLVQSLTNGAVGMSLGFTFDVYQLGWIVAAGLLGWVVALVFLRREYLKSLVSTLHRRRLNFEEAGFQINDEATIKTLDSALESHNVGHVLHALELLPHVHRKAREPLNDKVAKLVMHEANEVRVEVLQYLTEHNPQAREEVTELLEDSSRDVRAAAVLAYCAAHGAKSIERVEALLRDADRKVQAAAVAGLIKHGGLDGVLSCADLLKRWLLSEDELDRLHAAWVLGEVRVQNFYQPLIPLLADESERVRQEAIVAAGRLKNIELIQPLLEQLGRPRLNGAAVTALAAYGVEIQDTVGGVLADEHRDTDVRTQACRILARLGDSKSVEILLQYIDHHDAHLRAAAGQAIVAITQRLPGVTIPAETVNQAIRSEAQRWFENLVLQLDLRLTEDSVLLRDALSHRRRMAKSQILTLLGLKYPRETIELVANNLQSKEPTTQANAVEVLDNLFDKDEKAFLIPIFDDSTPEKRRDAGEEQFRIRSSTRTQRLIELLEGDDPWLRTCASQEVANEGLEQLVPQVEAMLRSSNPVNRETAIFVLSQLLSADQLRIDVLPLLHDEVLRVRRFAAHVLGEELVEEEEENEVEASQESTEAEAPVA